MLQPNDEMIKECCNGILVLVNRLANVDQGFGDSSLQTGC